MERFCSWPSWISARTRSHSRKGPERPLVPPDHGCDGETVSPSPQSDSQTRRVFFTLSVTRRAAVAAGLKRSRALRAVRSCGPAPGPSRRSAPACWRARCQNIVMQALGCSCKPRSKAVFCLTLARGEVPVMLALRLFLPESWTCDRVRLERAGVPVECRTERTKPEIALAEIDRVIAAGVRFGCVLADAGYGLSAPFRQGLTVRGLAWAVGIPRHLKVYPIGVQLIWPIAARGRPRRRPVPDILSIAAEDMLADAKWQNVSWRTGTKGRLKARFAAVRVHAADGPPQRIWDKGQQHLPGDEAWLIGEHRTSGEKKYYLANLPNLRTL